MENGLEGKGVDRSVIRDKEFAVPAPEKEETQISSQTKAI
jgi:hypothetical protein